MNLLEKAKQFKAGDKVTLCGLDIYGEKYGFNVTMGVNNFKANGYALSGSGWSRYSNNDKDTPCYELIARPYKAKLERVYNLGYKIVDIEGGWL